jgi:hypothetical protein
LAKKTNKIAIREHDAKHSKLKSQGTNRTFETKTKKKPLIHCTQNTNLWYFLDPLKVYFIEYTFIVLFGLMSILYQTISILLKYALL